jgi:hypothetical protein
MFPLSGLDHHMVETNVVKRRTERIRALGVYCAEFAQQPLKRGLPGTEPNSNRKQAQLADFPTSRAWRRSGEDDSLGLPAILRNARQLRASGLRARAGTVYLIDAGQSLGQRQKLPV